MNAKAKAVIRAAKAVGVPQVKASVYDLPKLATKVIGAVQEAAAKGQGKNVPANTVYTAAEFAKIHKMLSAIYDTISNDRSPVPMPAHNAGVRAMNLCDQAIRAVTIHHNYSIRDDVRADRVAESMSNWAARLSPLPKFCKEYLG